MGQGVGQKRVLFVDDEASIRMTLAPILEKAGFEVHVAESIPDALFEINSYQFDALITDLNIAEEGDGFLVASGMRHIQPNCKTFILTGYPAFETALQAIHSQVDDYLVKPVEVDALIAALKDKVGARTAKSGGGTRRISELLRENEEKIAGQLAQAVKAAAKDARKGCAVPAETIKGIVLSYVRGLAEQLRKEENAARPEALRAAAEHGALRRKAGCAVSVLSSDFRRIEDGIFQAIESGLTASEIAAAMRDVRRFNLGVSLLFEEALGAYTGAKA